MKLTDAIILLVIVFAAALAANLIAAKVVGDQIGQKLQSAPGVSLLNLFK